MKIRDCFDLNPPKNSNKYKDFINYIDTSSVTDGKLDEVSYLTSDFPSRAQRMVQYGDILYSSVRPNLKHYYYYRDNFDHPIASSGFVLLRNKDINQCDTEYTYYFLSTKEVVSYLSNIAELSQATFPSFLPKDLGGISLPNDNVESQRKIASILSTYDSHIENNQKRIKLLEHMAENLYKEWFVRFRFPGYEKEGLKSSKYGRIPASFDIKTMEEVFDYYIGGGWGEEQQSQDFPIEASVIRGADFPNVWHFDVSTCPRRYHKISNYKSRQLEPGDIILEISGGTSEQPVGRAVLATKELIDRFQDKHVICASFCKLVRTKKDAVTPFYFYYWLKYLYDTRIIDRFQLQSTGIINFKFESFLKKGTVVLPPMGIMKQFDDYVENIYCEMNNLAIQNELLIHQRDLLLPRLMSGKLSI